jgi:type I restriction enzyme S subunit
VAGNGDLNVKYYDGKFDAYQRTYIIESIDKKQLDVRYLFYLLSAYVDQLRRMSIGGVIKYIKLGYLTEAIFSIPPLPEQRRIAEILDKAEALRAERRAALAQLETFAESIFGDLFGDPATNSKEWKCQPLEQLSEKITDGEHLNPQFSEVGLPMVMAGNVLDDRIDFENCKMVATVLGEKFRRKCDPKSGDLLVVSRGATIGRLCLVGNCAPFCLMGSVILLRPRKDVIEPRFLTLFLKHPVVQTRLYKTSGSSAQQAMYIKDLKRLPCIVPPLALQRKLCNYTEIINKHKAVQRASLAKLDALFVSLQGRAFRGLL